MATVSIKIEGMHCQACVNRVRRTLEKQPELTVVEVQLGAARFESADPDAAIAAVTAAGYPAARA